MSDFLEAMGAASRSRIPRIRDLPPLDDAPPPVPLALSTGGFDVIAEAKLAGPASGRLLADVGDRADLVADLAVGFEHAGAVAVSVLTEPTEFEGSSYHLRSAVDATRLPVMRKDFLVDPRQVEEARAYGASGVLLIARLLDPARLVEMTDLTLALGMFALVEVFDPTDLNTASAVFDRGVMVGVNCRDLTTLQVDPHRLRAMRPLLPDTVVTVAESGITNPEEAARAADLGYRLALIGTALVVDATPDEVLRRMILAGRHARAEASR